MSKVESKKLGISIEKDIVQIRGHFSLCSWREAAIPKSPSGVVNRGVNEIEFCPDRSQLNDTGTFGGE
jgi:hypothetical protein